jgi:hypothetical protein
MSQPLKSLWLLAVAEAVVVLLLYKTRVAVAVVVRLYSVCCQLHRTRR